jgi:alginate O-acetyltransferase complex protein AlgJ
MLELAGPGSWGGSEGIDDGEREPSGQPVAIETVEITRVVTADDSRWQIDPEADVLVLGDSFANVFSLASMGWGDSAGLVEHLARSLGRPVDAIIRNDDAAFATREILARELARGRDRLATKRVVVWELTARELSSGDWRHVPMEPGSPGPSRFVVPPDDETWIVSGTIAAMGPVPRPRSAPYPDYIVALHLVDLEISEKPDQTGAEALVFVLAMEDSAWLPAAHYRIGQTLRLRLQSWAEKEAELGLINRGEIYDDELIFQEPCWGEEVP